MSCSDNGGIAASVHVGPAKNVPTSRSIARSNAAIRVSNLNKCYAIYEKPQDRLKQSVLPRLYTIFRRQHKQYYREFWALRDVSFEVEKGETIGVIGRNGSGKSTLLQILCGTLQPNSGTVEISGRVAALLELGSGFNAEFSGRENVYVYASVLGLSREEIDARLPDIIDFSGIPDFIDMPLKTYSSGMVVRLGFSVIAHVDADILIIDEALAVGDAFFVQKCMRFLRKFMENGTVLFVSHDMGAVNGLCQRAIWLQDGGVKRIGTPKEITESYLADTIEQQQGSSVRRTVLRTEMSSIPNTNADLSDQRLSYLNYSKFRNDIELFEFASEAASFGKGGATIVNVALEDRGEKRLTWCVGGEDVVLRIRCKAHADIFRPIVGFIVKDRLGQAVFGENTYLTYFDKPLMVKSESEFEACFHFRMPVLQVGEYSIAVAIAEGTQREHIQHHWIHDAMVFKSQSSSVRNGIIGIPMQSIELCNCRPKDQSRGTK